MNPPNITHSSTTQGSVSLSHSSSQGPKVNFSHGHMPFQDRKVEKSKKREASRKAEILSLATQLKVETGVASRGFFDIFSDFWNWCRGSSRISSQISVSVFQPSQEIQNQFYRSLKGAMQNWSIKRRRELGSVIRECLSEPSLAEDTKRAKEAKEWFDRELKEKLTEKQFGQMKKVSKAWEKRKLSLEKRSIQQNISQLVFSPELPIFPFNMSGFPNSTPLSFCGSGPTALFAAAETSSQGFAIGNVMMLFNLSEPNIQTLPTQAAALTAQLPLIYWVQMACGPDGYVHLIGSDFPGNNTYHGVIQNQAWVVLPYIVPGVPPITYAWTPAKLPGNGAVFASQIGSSYYLSKTDATGVFSAPPVLLYTSSSLPLSEDDKQTTLSFSDGSFRVLQNRYSPTGLYEIKFNTDGTNTTTEINNGQTMVPAIGVNTPIPGTNFTILLSMARSVNQSDSISVYDLRQSKIVSTRFLPGLLQQGQLTPEGFVSMCPPPYSNIHVVARDVFQAANFIYGMGIDVVDASQIGAPSIVGGGQSYYPIGQGIEAAPQAICLPNGQVMVTYYSCLPPAGPPLYFNFSFPLPPLTPPPSTPTTQPFIQIGSLTSVGTTFTPITSSQIILNPTFTSAPNSTLTLTSTGGYTVVYTATGLPVQLNTPFQPLQIYTMSIAHTNTSDTTPPTFEGCNSDGICEPSELATLSDINPPNGDPINWLLIGPIIAATFVVIGVIMGLVARFAWWPWHQRWKQRNITAFHAKPQPPRQNPEPQFPASVPAAPQNGHDAPGKVDFDKVQAYYKSRSFHSGQNGKAAIHPQLPAPQCTDTAVEVKVDIAPTERRDVSAES